jgi:L-lactate dehydrogenase
MALAYTLALRGVARELVLVGSNWDRARGEAMDLSHAHAFLRAPLDVRAGHLDEVADSDVVVISASVPMRTDLKDRNALAAGNVALMKTLLPSIAKVAPQTKMIVLSNPVDVLTWQALRLTGFPAERVMGIGTLVDSARFREALSRELAIHPDDIRSYVLGEHGNTQFPAMSLAQAGGDPIKDTRDRRALFASTVGAGLEVFRLKGHTCYAVALAAATTIEAILIDEKRTLPLSIAIDDLYGVSGVCLSLPVVVGGGGVEQVLHPPLNEREQWAFQQCAVAVREVIEKSGALQG